MTEAASNEKKKTNSAWMGVMTPSSPLRRVTSTQKQFTCHKMSSVQCYD